jgi:hypothetical protein
MQIFSNVQKCTNNYKTFAERCKSSNIVIPAKAGIQCFQGFSGFRIGPAPYLIRGPE